MTQPDHDPLLEALVSLNEASRHIATAKREVAEAMRERARGAAGPDGATAPPAKSSPAVTARFDEPSHDGVAQHDYAPLPHVAPFCAFDEPPSRPA